MHVKMGREVLKKSLCILKWKKKQGSNEGLLFLLIHSFFTLKFDHHFPLLLLKAETVCILSK